MRILVAGLGPTGISVVRELLKQGIKSEDILVLDAYLDSESIPSKRSKAINESLYSAVKRERQNRGIGKGGNSLNDPNSKLLLPSEIWGTSCLPPYKWDLGTKIFPHEEVIDAYRELSNEWEIQAEQTPELGFGISGERVGKLRRKALSHMLVRAGGLIHSRLAVQTQEDSNSPGCKLTGNCFAGCPNNAPWNPRKEIRKFHNQFPNVMIAFEKILSIDIRKKLVVTSNAAHPFDKLYLGVGAQETRVLIQPFFPVKVCLLSTPVVILPLLTKRKQVLSDYLNSFVFADLIAPITKCGKLVSLAQIYLPSKEISARIISTLPHFSHKLLAVYLQGFLKVIFQRLGVAMVFFEATEIEDQEIDANQYELSVLQLKNIFRRSKIKIIPGKKLSLLNGASYHYGSVHFQGEESYGVDSKLYGYLECNQVYLTDTSALPKIPPGPHTSISATLAKLIVRRSFQK